MKVVLTVVFLINGQWTLEEGFNPIEQPNEIKCTERLAAVSKYFDSIEEMPPYRLECIRKLGEGFEEDLKRMKSDTYKSSIRGVLL